MSMSMSMSMSPTNTMSGMDMPTSTSSGDMSSGMSMMGMESMAMTFFTSTMTPLFSTAWMPGSTGQYAGTCIFLIALATISRGLLALRLNFYAIVDMLQHRRYDPPIGLRSTRPWRASEAVMLATLDVVLAGVGYLLMVAVMTMNVGYFMSVLGGVFLGSLVVGYWTTGAGIC